MQTEPEAHRCQDPSEAVPRDRLHQIIRGPRPLPRDVRPMGAQVWGTHRGAGRTGVGRKRHQTRTEHAAARSTPSLPIPRRPEGSDVYQCTGRILQPLEGAVSASSRTLETTAIGILPVVFQSVQTVRKHQHVFAIKPAMTRILHLLQRRDAEERERVREGGAARVH